MSVFFKKSRFFNIFLSIILISLVFTGIGVKVYANVDLLRPSSVVNDGSKKIEEIKEAIKANDGGQADLRTVIIQNGHVFGPSVEMDFGIENDLWQMGILKIDGQIIPGNDRILSKVEVSVRDLYYDQNALTDFLDKSGDHFAYRAYKMFRDISLNEADKKIIRKNNLRCDITVIPPFSVGKEPVKTVGHYHPAVGFPGVPGIEQSYTEVYVVLYGKAIYYLQKIDNDGNVVDAVKINAVAGDIVPIPSTYGHVTINPSSDRPLIMMNWVDSTFDSVYGQIINLKGAAYYFIRDEFGRIEAVLNPAYKGKKVANLQEGIVTKDLAQEVGLPKNKPVYDVVGRPSDLSRLTQFLSNPDSSLNQQYDAILGRLSTVDKISLLDSKADNVFTGVKNDAFLGSLKQIKGENTGALVVGAQTILENVAAVSSLKRIKNSKSGIKIAVWAQDKKTMVRLLAMGVDEVADIITAEGLYDALSRLRKDGIAKANMVLINAPGDIVNIRKEFRSENLLQAELAHTKSINVKTPTAAEKEAGVNTMPLVFARAVTGILQNEPTVVKEYKDLSREYNKNGHISAEDLAKLNDLTASITEMPLVKTTEEVALAQVTYEATVNKI